MLTTIQETPVFDSVTGELMNEPMEKAVTQVGKAAFVTYTPGMNTAIVLANRAATAMLDLRNLLTIQYLDGSWEYEAIVDQNGERQDFVGKKFTDYTAEIANVARLAKSQRSTLTNFPRTVATYVESGQVPTIDTPKLLTVGIANGAKLITFTNEVSENAERLDADQQELMRQGVENAIIMSQRSFDEWVEAVLAEDPDDTDDNEPTPEEKATLPVPTAFVFEGDEHKRIYLAQSNGVEGLETKEVMEENFIIKPTDMYDAISLIANLIWQQEPEFVQDIEDAIDRAIDRAYIKEREQNERDSE